MFDKCSQMGCLSSRSTTVSPQVESGRSGSNHDEYSVKRRATIIKSRASIPKQEQQNGVSSLGIHEEQERRTAGGLNSEKENDNTNLMSENKQLDSKSGRRLDGGSISGSEELNDDTNRTRPSRNQLGLRGTGSTFDEADSSSESPIDSSSSFRQSTATHNVNTGEPIANDLEQTTANMSLDEANKSRVNSFDDELNMDLLRQYIAVDFEINQLEDRDALRLYHEKIEQLEQLERELDMINYEAEKAAVRSEKDLSQPNRASSLSDNNNLKDSKLDMESNSITSGASGSFSPKSSIRQQEQLPHLQMSNSQVGARSTNSTSTRRQPQQNKEDSSKQPHRLIERTLLNQRLFGLEDLSYTTTEGVFNRKIILEKERDKLKKEVEMVIIECDRLQQKYKKRDEILDKLFDGRTGNGLENHLEQQLNWLMEQKHYVDQVFYAWKRAETLTSQTCEQFASALELLKRIPKTDGDDQRNELAKSICSLLVKSREDMEQAQRYNPNVDAPFFTDAETERFDRIIETIQSSSISQSEYSQMATVVQFAYKRAVSIRLWLEQILQITIARDSFELAEEYKWIAIQLRKERISLINSKLQEPPYQAMVRSVREQLASNNQQRFATAEGAKRNGRNEKNRDSGVESDDIDIEEDIYRLLEMNKSRLAASVEASKQAGLPQATALDSTGRPIKPPITTSSVSTTGARPKQQALTTTTTTSQHDSKMRERIQRRVRGEQKLDLNHPKPPSNEIDSDGPMQQAIGRTGGSDEPTIGADIASDGSGPQQDDSADSHPNTNTTSLYSTPSKLRIHLDEASRQNLLTHPTNMNSPQINSSTPTQTLVLTQRDQDKSTRYTRSTEQN